MDTELVSAFLGLESLKVMIGFIIFLIFWATICSWVKLRKSKEYRKEISDMYVTGKIRDIAKNESINLDEEYARFKKWLKKKRNDTLERDFDDAVEDELKEKVEEKLDPSKDSSTPPK